MTPKPSIHVPWLLAALTLAVAGCAAALPAPAKPRTLACRAKAKQDPQIPLPASADRAALEAAARDYVRQCGLAEAVELTQALIAFPTVRAEQPAATGPAFAGMAQLLDGWARSAGAKLNAVDGNEVWELS